MSNILKNKWVLLGATLILGVFIGWIISSYRQGTPSTPQKAESSIEEIWTCSMHPQIRQNEAGDCPICGMDLIPLGTESEDELDPKALVMSPSAMQLAQVQTLLVGKDAAQKTLRLNGKVQADERLLFTQSSHIPGRIEKLALNFTGEFVSRGEVIAYVYSPDLATAQEELLEAQKIKERQPALFNAAKDKLKNWKLSDAQIDQILTANKAIEQFPILANVSGFVTEKMLNLGDYVKQGEAIYTIADLSKVWVLFDVYESDISWIKKGMALSYTVQSLPGQTFKGIISYIDPTINPKTRVAQARVTVENQGLSLKPEMFVTGRVESTVNTQETSLTVPKTAVMWTGKRSVVYVMKSNSQSIRFRMREVTLGPELGERYVIESGLQPGEEIAVNGTFSIDAAAQLAGKPSMMNREDKPISEEFKAILNELFIHYFKVKDALAEDDFKEALQAAKLLKSSLIEGPNHQKIAKLNHHQWKKQTATLDKSLAHLEHLKDIEELRKVFISISNVLITMAESFDFISNPVYVQHCPMADDNKGADWLSREKEILNPYFGEQMLDCGTTKRVLD